MYGRVHATSNNLLRLKIQYIIHLNKSMPRLFIGIKTQHINTIEQIQKELRGKLIRSNINWVHTDNFHLTLKFLGDVDSRFIKSISMKLGHISNKYRVFDVYLESLGCFGTVSRPGTIWIGCKPHLELSGLHNSVNKSLEELGFDSEKRTFLPHITLGRVKRLNEIDSFHVALQKHASLSDKYTIAQFQLIQSNLTMDGSEYRVLKIFYLVSSPGKIPEPGLP